MVDGRFTQVFLVKQAMFGAHDVDTLSSLEAAGEDTGEGNGTHGGFAAVRGSGDDVIDARTDGLHLGYVHYCRC